MKLKKLAPKLTVDDFRKFPVWEYTNADESKYDETVVVPVFSLPMSDLSDCLVGTELTLKNGSKVFGMMCNVDLYDAFKNSHFLMLTIFKKGKKFHLARYHDIDFDSHGPEQLAAFLGLPLGEVFPIAYDLSSVATGDEGILKACYPAKPSVQLTRKEIIRLAVG